MQVQYLDPDFGEWIALLDDDLQDLIEESLTAICIRLP